MPGMDRLQLAFLAVALLGAAADASSVSVSGVYPALATVNAEGECGTGAVVPWAGRLWYLSYAPHAPKGSTDKLYSLDARLTRRIHPGSIGGTPANRMVHRESNQLFIGPYAIDAQGNVRTIPYVGADGKPNLYGRPTACARHLTDPANKIYVMTMEEGLYEVDVKTLAVKELFRDGNIQRGAMAVAGSLLPGYHGKGGYSGQGRLVYANNGEYSPRARQDPTTASGCLAEWNGTPGTNGWRVVRRSQFTDVTSRGGIFGAADPARDPLWSIGWDFRSVTLMVLDGGGWTCYRLPKGSHSYDGAHGWNTEWPRIREIGEGDDFLMTMHGTFWHFPATMSARNAAGIRPRSNYLKVVGDFCRWGEHVVLGCDDTAKSEFLNKRRAKGALDGPPVSNSNLWFVKPQDLDGFGPAIGRGAVWQDDAVKAGEASDPYLLAGYDSRTLYLTGAGAFDLEVDVHGTGDWTVARRVTGDDCRVTVVPLDDLTGEWIRLRAVADASRVTAFFNYANADRRPAAADPIFAGVARPGEKAFGGIVRSGRTDLGLPLELVTPEGRYYRMLPDGDRLNLRYRDDPGNRKWVVKRVALDPKRKLGDGYDAASAFIVDDRGNRWRFPYADESWRGRVRSPEARLCREVCTERDLLNLAGTFYELPAENAGGYVRVRPITTHARNVFDYCSWRGLLVLSGVTSDAPADGHVVRSDDGRAAVWTGVADDLWKFGKARGVGGPWRETRVAAGDTSDPYLMTGYDRKRVTLEADCDVTVTLQLDVTGTGKWTDWREFTLCAGARVSHDVSGVRAYWVRTRANAACRVSVQFVYD